MLLVYLFRRFMDYWTVFVDGIFLVNKYAAWGSFHLGTRGKKVYMKILRQLLKVEIIKEGWANQSYTANKYFCRIA